jgi:hypothetical protein
MIGEVVVTMILRTAAYFVGYTFSIIHLCKKKTFIEWFVSRYYLFWAGLNVHFRIRL